MPNLVILLLVQSAAFALPRVRDARAPGYPSGYSPGYSSGYRPGYHQSGVRAALRLEYGWKYIDYDFLSANARNAATRSGEFNYTAIIPRDMDVWEKDGRRKVFITTPVNRRKRGVPATLSTMPDQGDHSQSPLLAPYPDWTWHRKRNDSSSASSACDSTIGTVHRITIDELDRLWVVDDGDSRCKRKLLVFDLNTDRLIDSYEFPAEVLKSGSSLITPVVDVRNKGRNTFVYIADVWGHGIIVYDHQNKLSWRVEHSLFSPEPEYENIEIRGTALKYSDGVFGMALSPLPSCNRCTEDRTLYFHSLASLKENYVNTSVLRNPQNFPNGINRAESEFKSFEALRPSQSAGQDMTRGGVLFSGLLSDLAITCWRTGSQGSPFPGPRLQTVIRDPDALQFIGAVKVRGDRLWVLSTRAQRFATNTMDWSQVNYRIMSASVAEITRGTACDWHS